MTLQYACVLCSSKPNPDLWLLSVAIGWERVATGLREGWKKVGEGWQRVGEGWERVGGGLGEGWGKHKQGHHQSTLFFNTTHGSRA